MTIRAHPRYRMMTVVISASVFAAAIAPAPAAEPVEKVESVLARQTQELLDAIGSGSAAVWEKYLDDGAIYVDESGNVTPKKQMVADIRPLPEGEARSRGARRALRSRPAAVSLRVPARSRRQDHRIRAAPRGLGHRLDARERSAEVLIRRGRSPRRALMNPRRRGAPRPGGHAFEPPG